MTAEEKARRKAALRRKSGARQDRAGFKDNVLALKEEIERG